MNSKRREQNQKLPQEQKDAKNRKRRELAAAARAKKAMPPSTVPAAEEHLCHLCKKVFASKQGLEVHQKRKICGPESVSVNTICCQCSSSNLLFCLNLTFIC